VVARPPCVLLAVMFQQRPSVGTMEIWQPSRDARPAKCVVDPFAFACRSAPWLIMAGPKNGPRGPGRSSSGQENWTEGPTDRRGKSQGLGISIRVRAMIEARRASKAIGLSLSIEGGASSSSPHHYNSSRVGSKQGAGKIKLDFSSEYAWTDLGVGLFSRRN